MAGEPEQSKQGQQSAEELRYLDQVYSERYSMLNAEIRELVVEIGSLNNSKKTLQNLGAIKGRRILTAISGIMQINSAVEDAENILVDVGGGYIVEKKIKDAQRFLDSTIEEKNKQLNALSKEKDEVESILLGLSYELSKA